MKRTEARRGALTIEMAICIPIVFLILLERSSFPNEHVA